MMRSDTFGISVVIPTRNGVQLVQRLLASLELARQKTNAPVEVLIVDDSSPDQRATMQQLCQKYGVRYILGERSVGVKRNQGIQAAQYFIILFLDSDVEVSPDLLLEHMLVYEASSDKVGGCLGVVDFVGPRPLWCKVALESPFIASFQLPRNLKEVDWGPTANISFRKVALEAIGGFDTSFPPQPGGEDVDLCLRLTKADYRIRCNPSAIVHHTTATWSSIKQNTRRFYSWGRADYYLIKRHPNRTFPDMPRLPLIASAAFAIGLFQTLLLRDWLPLLAALVALVVTFLVRSTLQRPPSGAVWNLKSRFVLYFYLFVNEFGFFIQCMKQLDFSTLGRRMRYTSEQDKDFQLAGEWIEADRTLWATLAGFCCWWAIMFLMR